MAKKLLYFTDELSSTVRESQVKENLDFLADKNVHLFIPISLKTMILKRRSYISMVDSWRKSSEYRIILYPILFRREVNFSTNIIVFFVVLFQGYFKDIVLFTRTRSVWVGLLMIKKITSARLLLDNRGAWPEEYRESHLLAKFSFLVDIKYRLLKTYYSFCLDTADASLVVSDGLKKYSESISSLKSYFVMPCTASSGKFVLNEEKRREVRANLGLKDDLVLIYSGSLFEYYQNADELFKFFKRCVDSIPRVKILCVTPDFKRATSLANHYGITNNVICLTVSANTIPDYLSASDVGVVLRKDLVTNFVASPTKVAEMLICGLPLVISPSLRDYARHVREFDSGLVIDSLEKFDYSLLETLKSSIHQRTIRGVEASKKFSKEVYLNSYRKFIYEDIIS